MCCIVFVLPLFATLGEAAEVDKEFLQSLPAEEQAMKDTVDHWGLPFADQLRRFLAGRSSFRKVLDTSSPNGFIIGVQHGLEKVAKNKYWFKGTYAAAVSLEAARNEYENFQIAVLPDIGKALSRVTITSRDLHLQGGRGTISSEMIRVYRVGYVKTIPAAYPSLYTGFWPDCLLPNAPLEVRGTDLGLFWVEVKVPRGAAPGVYEGQLLVEADGESVPVKVTLQVHAFALPDRVPFPIAVWTSPQLPSGDKMSLEDYRSLLAEFLEHGLDPVSIGKAYLSLEENDFKLLDENLEFCFARGLQLFEIPSPRGKPEKLKPLVDHLRKKDWLEKAVVYSNQDEPDANQFNTKNIPFCREMNTLYPDLRVFLASQYHPGIDRGCNIWMTDLSTGKGPEFAQSHHGKADLWFYYCHLPIRIDFWRPMVHAPCMQIDNEAIEHRLALWIAWKYGTKGMFIWAGNREWVKKDVDRTNWEKTGWKLSEKPYEFPYGGIHNGNGYLVYPGPHPSIRTKVLRDGLEDYGYLMELKKRAGTSNNKELQGEAEKLLCVPPEVLVDAHYFNRNPNGLMETRKKMARLIDALGG